MKSLLYKEFGIKTSLESCLSVGRSVGWSVCRLVGLSVCPPKITKVYKTLQNTVSGIVRRRRRRGRHPGARGDRQGSFGSMPELR